MFKKKNSPGCGCCQPTECLVWKYSYGFVYSGCESLASLHDDDERWDASNTWSMCKQTDAFDRRLTHFRESLNDSTPLIVSTDVPNSDGYAAVTGEGYLKGEGAGVSVYCDYEDADNYHRIHMDFSSIDDVLDTGEYWEYCPSDAVKIWPWKHLRERHKTFRIRIYKATNGTETLLRERALKQMHGFDSVFTLWEFIKFCVEWDGQNIYASFGVLLDDPFFVSDTNGVCLEVDTTFHNGRKWGIGQETADPSTQEFAMWNVSQFKSSRDESKCGCPSCCPCYVQPESFQVEFSNYQERDPMKTEYQVSGCSNLNGTYTLDLMTEYDNEFWHKTHTSGCVWRYVRPDSETGKKATTQIGDHYIQEMRLFPIGDNEFHLWVRHSQRAIGEHWNPWSQSLMGYRIDGIDYRYAGEPHDEQSFQRPCDWAADEIHKFKFNAKSSDTKYTDCEQPYELEPFDTIRDLHFCWNLNVTVKLTAV